MNSVTDDTAHDVLAWEEKVTSRLQDMTPTLLHGVALLSAFSLSVSAADFAKPVKTAPAEIKKVTNATVTAKTAGEPKVELPPASPLEAELRKARTELRVLRESHKVNHPEVQEKLRTIALLEAKLALREAPAATVSELQKAREELEVMRITMREKHPAVQAQLRKIAELERDSSRQ